MRRIQLWYRRTLMEDFSLIRLTRDLQILDLTSDLWSLQGYLLAVSLLQWVASSADTALTTLLRRRDERSVRERVILNLLMLSAHWYCWALLSWARLRWCVEECMTDSLHCRCLSVCISDDLLMTERAYLSLSACLWHWPTTAADNYNNFSMISYWMGKREHEKSIGRNDVKCKMYYYRHCGSRPFCLHDFMNVCEHCIKVWAKLCWGSDTLCDSDYLIAR